LILKLNSISRKKIIEILQQLGSISIMTAELYLSRFLDGQLNKIIDDNRGKYHRESVFEYFPDLKDHLFEYTVEKVSEKKSLLNLKSLVNVAKNYMETNHNDLNEVKNFHAFYSIHAIRSLLDHWGFVWSNNKLRPFVNGHERDDVVEYRKLSSIILH
jgi:hypothetical protein